MLVQRLYTGEKITLEIDDEIASGGEGRIYPVLYQSSIVAKIYHKPTDEKADKLMVMHDTPPDVPQAEPGHAAIAWPIDLLCKADGSQKVIGFLMPRVNKAVPIHTFYTPKTRREQKPLFSYQYLHRTARNLAAAFHALHAREYAIGDVNESNIFVTDTALVTLLDPDSFQVKDPHHQFVHRCPVGKPEFTPPELQGQSFRDIDRTPEHDRFGLAILIFQLLMEGTHPFAGIYQGVGDPPPIEARIKAGHFPYATKQKVPYKPMLVAPPWEMLYPKLQDLFIQCFENGYKNPAARPDAKTWIGVLKEAEDTLITCQKNPQHRHSNHLKNCPWCDRAKLLKGRDPFPSKEAVEKRQHLQPLNPKPKISVPESIIRANSTGYLHHQTSKKSPTPKPPVGLPRKVGQYHPPIYISHPQPPSKQWVLPTPGAGLGLSGVFQDAGLGMLWGAILLGSIDALGYIVQGEMKFLGAVVIGSIIGSCLAIIFDDIMTTNSHSKILSVFLGIVAGSLLLPSALSLFFSLDLKLTFLAGMIPGGIWATVWSTFKPPLALPSPGNMKGKRGFYLGGIWGAFGGIIIGGLMMVAIVLWWLDQAHWQIDQKVIPLMLGLIVSGAGLFSVLGLILGMIVGALVGAPKLYLPQYLLGKDGASLGCIWGTFLGVGIGIVLSVIFLSPIGYHAIGLFSPRLGNFFDHSNQLEALISGCAVVGLSGMWGLISGLIWGAIGKW